MNFTIPMHNWRQQGLSINCRKHVKPVSETGDTCILFLKRGQNMISLRERDSFKG